VDEFKEAGLTPAKADLVTAPKVGESPINLECRIRQILYTGEGDRRGSLIMGDLLRVHIRDELLENGEIQMDRLKAIARLGGEWYCRTRDLFTMPRPPD
jgi:flavin reductase (DIM6/NTAB) family NADH-FMN oxidoreductase RutF